MEKSIDPYKFSREEKVIKKYAAKVCGIINQEAKEATIELLKGNGDKCFVVCEKDYGEAETIYDDKFNFYAIGLGISGKNSKQVRLLVGGIVAYKEDGELYPEPFVATIRDLDKMKTYSYTDVYRFVAENIANSSFTREEAESKLSKMKACFSDETGEFEWDDEDDE